MDLRSSARHVGGNIGDSLLKQRQTPITVELGLLAPPLPRDYCVPNISKLHSQCIILNVQRARATRCDGLCLHQALLCLCGPLLSCHACFLAGFGS